MSVFLPFKKILESLTRLPGMSICLLGIIMLTAACNTNPAKQTASADTAAANASGNAVAANEEKEVCHYVKGTGTNIPRKVCASQKAWDAYDEKTRDDAAEFTRITREKGSINPPTTPEEQAIGRGTVSGAMSP